MRNVERSYLICVIGRDVGEAYSRIMTICLCLTYLFVSKKLILELFSKFYVSQLQCYFTPLVFQNADYLNLIVLVLIT